MANIREIQAGKKYRVQVYLGRSPGGKSRFQTKTVNGTKTDANRVAKELEAAATLSPSIASGSSAGTVQSLVLRYVGERRSTGAWKPTTAQNMRLPQSRLAATSFAGLDCDTVKVADCNALVQLLQAEGLHSNPIRDICKLVSGAFSMAVRLDEMPSNPMKSASRPGRKRGAANMVPSDSEIQTILDAETDPMMATMLALIIATGLRKGEICCMQWSNFRQVENGADSLVVNQQITTADKQWSITSTKSTHSDRVIPLDKDTSEMLVGYRDSIYCVSDNWMFSPYASTIDCIRPSIFGYQWEQLRTTLKLEHVNLHHLRHYFANTLIEAHVPTVLAASLMGHSVEVFNRNYSHLVNDLTIEQLARLTQLRPKKTQKDVAKP